MSYQSYEQWKNGLTKEQLEEMYQLGGERTEFGLMTAYHKIMKESENV